MPATAPHVADHRTLEHRGTTVAYRTRGPADAPVLLLLSPAFAAQEVHDEDVAALGDRLRVVTLDLPGHGATVGGGATMADAVAVVTAVLDAEGVASAHVVGISLGSLVAQALTHDHPERVRSLTVVGGYSVRAVPDDVTRAQRREALRSGLLGLTSMTRFRRHLAEVSCATPSGRSAFAHAIAGYSRGSFRSMSGTSALERRGRPPLAVPLLVVVGALDLPVSRSAAAALHREQDGSRLAVVRGSGHCVPLDAGDEWRTLLLDHVRAAEAAAAR